MATAPVIRETGSRRKPTPFEADIAVADLTTANAALVAFAHQSFVIGMTVDPAIQK